MNTPLKTLIGLLTLTFVAVPAVAIGGDLAGYGRVEANADAYADYSGAIDAVESVKEQAKADVSARAEATYDGALRTKGAVGDKAVSAQMTSMEAKTTLADSIKANLDAFASWASSLWIRPNVDLKSDTLAEGVGGLGSTVQHGEGYVAADIVQELESTGRVEYNLPPPPQPKVDFLTSIKMAFESFLQLG